ncbi:MAG: AEC family transporter, partial [Candidatus Krumholzibacteria bacterium]|nr:AEC family transporter [Candidatus Krumholzibacteria bacterium]
MSVIYDVVLPILFIVALGFVFRRLGGRYERAFSRTQLYILVPALLFTVVSGAAADLRTIGTVLLYVAILSAVLIGITQGLGFLAGSRRAERNAITLAGVFTNSGFYGIPVCMLAFGEAGLIWASVYVIASSTIQSTVGVFVASAGRRRAVDAFASVFKVPLIWALVAGKGLAALGALPP